MIFNAKTMPRHTSITTRHNNYTRPNIKVIDIATESLLTESNPTRLRINDTSDSENWINNSEEII